MKINFNWKSILPHAGAILFFLLITIGYMSPMLEGESLVAHDNVQSIGLSQELKKNYEETGKINRWTNSVFSGMPAFRIWGSSKLNEISKVISLFKLNLPKPMSNLFFYLIGFYIFMIAMGMSPFLSAIASIAFAFGSYNIILLEAGHSTKATTIATIPMVFAGVYLVYVKKKYFLGGALAALFFAIAIRSNHVQIGYYIAFMLIFFVISEAIFSIMEKRFKDFAIGSLILLSAGALGLATNTSYLWTTYEYSKESIRGGKSELSSKKNDSGGLDTDYAWRWSYGISETLTLLVPNYAGGASTSKLGENSNTYKELSRNRVPANQAKRFISNLPTYHGDQPFTSGPVYIGSIIFFLALIGLILAPARYKYWLLTLSIVTIFMSWGKNWTDFNLLFFENMPMYNKFRVPAMALVMTSFALLWLAVLGLKEVLTNKDKAKLTLAWKVSSGICAGILLILLFIAGGLDYSSNSDAQFGANQQWIIDAIKKDRAAMLRTDIFRSLIFIGLAAAAIFFYVKKSIKKEYLLIGIGLLVLVDLWTVDKRYLDASDFKDDKQVDNMFRPTQADRQILQDPDPHYRVFNTTSPSGPFNDALTSYFHKAVGGYHAAKMMRYQDLIERHLSTGNMNVFNMLNTKYFINKDQQGAPVANVNPNALGNAWFVREHRIVENADEEMNALTSFNPAETVLIDKRFASYVDGYSFSYNPANSIKLTSYDSDHMVYQSNASADQLAVFSEIYYNGKDWRAYIDGENVPHIRVNYVLRALKVPSGQHTIEFRFLPKSFYTGRKVSAISFYLLILLVLGSIGFELKNKLISEEKEESR